MPVWGPILVFSELTAVFSSQTASRVILNHHQINYLCSLSPTFLLPPFCLSTTLSTNLMFYGQIISSCSSAEDTLGALEGRETVTRQDNPLKLQEVQGKHLLGGCYPEWEALGISRWRASPRVQPLPRETSDLLPQSASLGRRPVTR